MILKVRKTENLTKISPQGMINSFLWLRMSCFKMPCVSNRGKYKNKVFFYGNQMFPNNIYRVCGSRTCEAKYFNGYSFEIRRGKMG